MVERIAPLRERHRPESGKRPAHAQIIANNRGPLPVLATLVTAKFPFNNATERRKKMRFTRMIIGEAVSDDLLNQIVARMQEHVATMDGALGHSILIEEGGRMVILISDWPNREDCLTYHASRAYR